MRNFNKIVGFLFLQSNRFINAASSVNDDIRGATIHGPTSHCWKAQASWTSAASSKVYGFSTVHESFGSYHFRDRKHQDRRRQSSAFLRVLSTCLHWTRSILRTQQCHETQLWIVTLCKRLKQSPVIHSSFRNGLCVLIYDGSEYIAIIISQ